MSIWQTRKWQQMLKRSGQVSDFFEIPLSKSFPQGEKDFLYVEKRSIGLGEYGLFVIGVDKQLNKEILEKLKDLVKKQKCLFFQIETINYTDNNYLTFLRELPKKSGVKKGYYKKFITPYTAVIDLQKSEEEILKDMKPKGRYNIRLAERKGIKIKLAEKTDENIKKFYDLVLETTTRDGFAGNSFEYYKIFLSDLDESRLFLAYFEDEVIAAGIFIFTKDVAIYYYGASSSNPKYRNLMSPYLLQWEAIKYAKKQNCKIYDFLGVASPGDARSNLLGVTGFKLKLTKDLRWVSESYIFINKKIKYLFLSTLRKIRK